MSVSGICDTTTAVAATAANAATNDVDTPERKSSSSFTKYQTDSRIYFDFGAKMPDGTSKKVGRLVFELFGRSTPMTTEVFRQLCTGERKSSCANGVNSNGKFYEGMSVQAVAENYGIVLGQVDITAANLSNSRGAESFSGKAGHHFGLGCLSMCTCGPGGKSTGQVLIGAVSTPWLNGHNVVIGKLVEGRKVLQDLMREFGSTNDDTTKQRQLFVLRSGEIEAGGHEYVPRPKCAFEFFKESLSGRDIAAAAAAEAYFDGAFAASSLSPEWRDYFVRSLWRDLPEDVRFIFTKEEVKDRKRYDNEVAEVRAKAAEKSATSVATNGQRKRKRSGGRRGGGGSRRTTTKAPILPLDTPITMLQENPKRGMSRDRYEKYKHAKTIGEFLELGGSTGDIRNDRSKGFLRVLEKKTPAVQEKRAIQV